MSIKIKNILTFKFASTKDIEGPHTSLLFWDWLFSFDSDTTNIADFVETVHDHSSDCIRQQISIKELSEFWDKNRAVMLESSSKYAIMAMVLIDHCLENEIDFITRAA